MTSPEFDPELQDDDTSLTSNKKRKTHGTSTSGRGVLNLSKEQLDKKRANDREAQRAIRERTKDKIYNLERRIQELTLQQPYQELQAVINQKDAVQEENEELRRRLALVYNTIQPVLDTKFLQGGSVGSTHVRRSHPHPNPLLDLHSNNAQQIAASVFQQDQYMNERPPRSASATTSSMLYGPSFPPTEQDLNADPQSWQNPREALNTQRDTIARSHELSENGERLTFGFLVDARIPHWNALTLPLEDRRGSPRTPAPSSYVPQRQPRSLPRQYNELPKNCEPTCQLDNILLEFVRARQQENAQYVSGKIPTPAYASPLYPSLSNLLNPEPPNSTSKPTLANIMTNIVSQFQNIRGLPERVAIIYAMFLMMRWQCYPTQRNYERLPEWLAPSHTQLVNAHPAWIDHLPWPQLRDQLVVDYESYPFVKWFLPFTNGISVNWPHDAIDCLISIGENEEPHLNPIFEKHIRRLENWSVGPEFIAEFPALENTVRVLSCPNSMNNPYHGKTMPQGLMGLEGAARLALPMYPQQQQRHGHSGTGQGSGAESDAGATNHKPITSHSGMSTIG